MKTLYERLQPEIIDGLKNNEERWGEMTEHCYDVLRSTLFWQDLRVSDVSSIITFSDTPFAKITANTFRFGENIIKDEK